MDKKDDSKKPSKKDKKKDKKDKKLTESKIAKQKKKVIKKKTDDKISQIVNIKIGDISKPRTRTRRAPPKPAPPQIQRQLQYLPSLAGQAPMIPPPLAPAPAPAPRPPPPPAPPPPVAEPRRTGDFFSDTSKSSEFGTSYDLGSASLDDLTSVARSASRPSMSRAFNRPRSDSGVSAMTDPTYADFDNFSDFNASAPSRYGSSYDLESMTSAPPPAPVQAPAPPQLEFLGTGAGFEALSQPTSVLVDDLGSNASTWSPQPPSITSSISAPPPPLPSDDESTIDPPPPYQSDDESTIGPPPPPPSSKSVNPFLEELKSKLAVPDYGFGNFGLISSNVPMSQPILGLQPDPVPQDLVLSTQKPIELKIPKPVSDARDIIPKTEEPVTTASAIEPVVAVPVTEDPMISEPVKGDVNPEDEATGGGGPQPIKFYEMVNDPVKENLLFTRYTYEKALHAKKLDGGVKSAKAAVAKYNIVGRDGQPLDSSTFSARHRQWLSKEDRQKEFESMTIEQLKKVTKKAKKEVKKAEKESSGAAAVE